MAEPTQGERVAVIETNVTNILSLLKIHVKEERQLAKDVVVCQTNITWIKRVAYVVGGSALTLFLAMLGFDKIKF